MYTYQIFAADDNSNSRVNMARESFKRVGVPCYVISVDGRMNMIQFLEEEPYPGRTLEESAQNHITALLIEQEN